MTLTDRDDLAAPFEENRSHLRGVAYRMLGSVSEADDAVQETWLRLHRSDTSDVQNLRGWLTTVVARVCLDMLRARKARREDALEPDGSEPVAHRAPGANPEDEALLADSVGLALLVVLDTLAPAERLAFVLHDLFGVSFEEIAPIVRRSEAATRQLASRARRRVRGRGDVDAGDIASQREVIDAFLAALRAGDVQGLLAVLDPDLAVHADAFSRAPGSTGEVHGAENWARGAVAYARAVRLAEPALLDGAVGLIMAPRGRLVRALTFTFAAGKIATMEVIGDPERLKAMELAALE